MTKLKLLTGASAAVALTLALAGGGHATGAVVEIYGGGATSTAPAVRQAGDCYGNQVPLVTQGSILSGGSANETTVTLNAFNFLGSPAFNCAAAPVGNGPYNPNETVNYISANSSAGIAAFYSHDATTFWGDTIPGTDPSDYPAVNFANSDYGLAAADVAIWNNGGTEGSSPTAVTVVGPTGTASPPTTYPNPAKSYGPQIQLPLVIVPLALAYSSVYKSVADGSGVVTNYTFNVAKPNKDGSGGLVLDVPTLCAIFNGKITLWSDPALTALNGGKSLKNTKDTGTEFATLPIELVGRADSAGNTASVYRALAAQCGQGSVTYTEAGDSYTYTNAYLPAGSKKLPSALAGKTYVTGAPNNGPAGSYTQLGQVGKFTLATLASGVAEYIDTTTVKPAAGQTLLWGRLGYISPDYVLPAVTNTADNSYSLNVVDLKVNGVAVEPTGASALAAFGTYILPPQSSSAGAYVAGSTAHGLRAAPEDWVEPISTTLTYSNQATATPTPLADPNAWAFANNGGVATSLYPIVNTSNVNLYTCYASSTTAKAVTSFFDYFLTSKTIATAKTGLLAEDGLSALPKAWLTAIADTFLLAPPTKGNLGSLGLYVSTAGSTAPQCASVTPGA